MPVLTPCDCRYCKECQARLYGLKPIATDQKTVAERKWRAGLKPAKPQKPLDIGLFSDDAAQLELCEMFMQPTNEE